MRKSRIVHLREWGSLHRYQYPSHVCKRCQQHGDKDMREGSANPGTMFLEKISLAAKGEKEKNPTTSVHCQRQGSMPRIEDLGYQRQERDAYEGERGAKKSFLDDHGRVYFPCRFPKFFSEYDIL